MAAPALPAGTVASAPADSPAGVFSARQRYLLYVLDNIPAEAHWYDIERSGESFANNVYQLTGLAKDLCLAFMPHMACSLRCMCKSDIEVLRTAVASALASYREMHAKLRHKRLREGLPPVSRLGDLVVFTPRQLDVLRKIAPLPGDFVKDDVAPFNCWYGVSCRINPASTTARMLDAFVPYIEGLEMFEPGDLASIDTPIRLFAKQQQELIDVILLALNIHRRQLASRPAVSSTSSSNDALLEETRKELRQLREEVRELNETVKRLCRSLPPGLLDRTVP